MPDAARPRRVLVLSRSYPPEVGAAGFRVRAVVRALADQGDSVLVLTSILPKSMFGDLAEADKSKNVRVRRFPVLRDSSGNIRGYFSYLSYDIPMFFRALALFPKRRRPDVILAEAPPTTGFFAMLLAKLMRRPFVYYPGDVWTDAVISMGGSKPLVSAMRAVESKIISSADAALGVSEEVAERLRFLGGKAAAVELVGNGIDLEVFNPDVKIPSEAPDRYFVYTGTMSEWQRPEIFVEALALLNEAVSGDPVKLFFFGQGTSSDVIRERAQALGLSEQVQISGLVPPADAASWLRGAAAALVSIVPGIGYDFAKPTKSYAAAAVGTPVLFAGAETGAALVRDADLGVSVDFEAAEIAAAMADLLLEGENGGTEAKRAERSNWASENVSLAAAGQKAADAVRVVSPRTKATS